MPDQQPKPGLFYSSATATRVEAAEERPAEARPPERKGLSRRLVFRWVGWGTILALLGQWTAGTVLAFMWPKKLGAFGGVVNAGNAADFQVGDVRVVRDGKFYVARVPEGFVALWWKCPHLGCTVPWKPDDPSMDPFKDKGRFNCPCHGSIYDRYGQILSGPAPRPMDRFPLEIKDGKVLVSTGPDKVQTRVQALHGPPDVTPAS